MSYQKDRDEFIGVIMAELPDHEPYSVAVELARLILRNAQTIQRCEERVCSDESANRDRVPCPAIRSHRDEDCCCDYMDDIKRGIGSHKDTPRVEVQSMHARQRIQAACKPWGIMPTFSGDPRGACVKLILPSGRYNSCGGAECGFCVPTR
jgi:hypothetical protein